MSKEVRPLDSTGKQSARNLHRISAALGIPEAAFLDGHGVLADLDAASELLRIWVALPNDADRRKVLAFARAIALRD